jgi:hypothetical protein
MSLFQPGLHSGPLHRAAQPAQASTNVALVQNAGRRGYGSSIGSSATTRSGRAHRQDAQLPASGAELARSGCREFSWLLAELKRDHIQNRRRHWRRVLSIAANLELHFALRVA